MINKIKQNKVYKFLRQEFGVSKKAMQSERLLISWLGCMVFAYTVLTPVLMLIGFMLESYPFAFISRILFDWVLWMVIANYMYRTEERIKALEEK